MKFFIIPKSMIIGEIDAADKEEALNQFAYDMDSDMNAYFQAMTEDEYEQYLNQQVRDAHIDFVTDWMISTFMADYNLTRTRAEEFADLAYDLYCQGDGLTEYECVEATYDKYCDELDDEDYKHSNSPSM